MEHLFGTQSAVPAPTMVENGGKSPGSDNIDYTLANLGVLSGGADGNKQQVHLPLLVLPCCWFPLRSNTSGSSAMQATAVCIAPPDCHIPRVYSQGGWARWPCCVSAARRGPADRDWRVWCVQMSPVPYCMPVCPVLKSCMCVAADLRRVPPVLRRKIITSSLLVGAPVSTDRTLLDSAMKWGWAVGGPERAGWGVGSCRGLAIN